MSMLDDAIETIRMGNREEGRRLLEEILETDESNEEVWLWLSSVVDSDEDREVCLENVLALDPDNVVAQKGLEALRSGTFNVQDLMSEAIEQEPISGSTFLDEFRRSADTLDEDEELVLPSTMAKSKGKTPKKKSAGFKLNLRLVLLAVFVLLIILALGGLAVARMLMGGEADNTGAPVVQPGQETPAGGGEPPATDQPPAVETAPPLPTDTPTPTNTPFQLPTPKPTDLPTPTATPVVPPTPG